MLVLAVKVTSLAPYSTACPRQRRSYENAGVYRRAAAASSSRVQLRSQQSRSFVVESLLENNTALASQLRHLCLAAHSLPFSAVRDVGVIYTSCSSSNCCGTIGLTECRRVEILGTRSPIGRRRVQLCP